MLHKIHRLSACLISAFVAVHLFNHLLALQSIQAHIGFMESFRHLYRIRLVETILLACVTFQAGSGIYFIRARWGKRSGFFERLQAASGAYLAFFLTVHVGAVLFGRGVLKLDTNFYYAAAGMHIAPFQYFFVPYYMLAVAAIFGHIACAVHWLTRGKVGESARNYAAYALMAGGLAASGCIVAAFSGAFYDVTIPLAYRTTYQQ